MRIRVLRRHIVAGEAGNGRACPLALAIREHCANKGIAVRVSREVASVDLVAYLLPVEAQNFVDQFDNHGRDAVRPFTFTLEGL
jgi:hypothetical protein